jgi:hypothetical protein
MRDALVHSMELEEARDKDNATPDFVRISKLGLVDTDYQDGPQARDKDTARTTPDQKTVRISKLGWRGPDMNKAKWLKRVNVLLFCFLLFQPVTALLAGVIGDAFEVLHPAGGVILVVLAFAHLSLNWAWVRSAILAKKR